jgi:hypothetical protein
MTKLSTVRVEREVGARHPRLLRMRVCPSARVLESGRGRPAQAPGGR